MYMMLAPVTEMGQGGQPMISFDSLSIDFGEVTAGETLRHVFIFTNKGSRTLAISEVAPT